MLSKFYREAAVMQSLRGEPNLMSWYVVLFNLFEHAYMIDRGGDRSRL